MIRFTTVRWRNLLSTGNYFNEVNLDAHKTTLIIGKNGSGKSTFIEAITFALFGKPFRNINKPTLLNSINQRDCVVEIEFKIGPKLYKVRRGIKPTFFEIYIDGTMLNQSANVRDYQEHLEKHILKMNYKSFKQIIVLGSASFVPFMQLKASDRRDIIEDLLDIQIFSSMNVILKQKLGEIKDSLLQLKYDQDVLEVKISSAEKLIKELKAKTQEKIEENKKLIKENRSHIDSLNEEISNLSIEVEELQAKISEFEKLKVKSKKFLDLESQLEGNVKKITKEIKFYEDNNNCPTCQQEIAECFKHSKKEDFNKKNAELQAGLTELSQKIEAIEAEFSGLSELNQEMSEKNTELYRMNTSVSGLSKYIAKLQVEIDKLQEEKTGDSKVNEKELKKLVKQRDSFVVQKETLINNRHYYEIAAGLLKDTGIKTKIIKQYLPIINKTVNKYLSAMDFFVNFNLDENFTESIKSRHRDEFSYENFSEGEKMRIDLSLLFTWRAIAKLRNSVNTNLAIFDEIFDSSLDSASTDAFMSILQTLGEDTNIFIISHKTDTIADKFDHIIEFQKTQDFSRIVE